VARWYPGPAHEPPHGHRGLPGQQLNVVEPGAAAPVEVLNQPPGQRKRLREALPDRAARGHLPDPMLSQDRTHKLVRVQRADEFDLARARQRHAPAGPHRQAQIVGVAQHRRARGAEPPADLIGGKAVTAVQVPQRAGRKNAALLTLPAAPGARADAVPAETITHGPGRDSQHRSCLLSGEMPVDIQLGEDLRQVRRVAAAALWPPPASATGPQRHPGPAQQAGDPLPVKASDLPDPVRRQPVTDIQVHQPGNALTRQHGGIPAAAPAHIPQPRHSVGAHS
jgi:hypothetical protein